MTERPNVPGERKPLLFLLSRVELDPAFVVAPEGCHGLGNALVWRSSLFRGSDGHPSSGLAGPGVLAVYRDGGNRSCHARITDRPAEDHEEHRDSDVESEVLVGCESQPVTLTPDQHRAGNAGFYNQTSTVSDENMVRTNRRNGP